MDLRTERSARRTPICRWQGRTLGRSCPRYRFRMVLSGRNLDQSEHPGWLRALAILAVASLASGIAITVWSIGSVKALREREDDLLVTGSRATAEITDVGRQGGELCGLVDITFTSTTGPVVVHNLEIFPPTAPYQSGDTLDIVYDPNDAHYVREVGQQCGDRQGEGWYWALAAAGTMLAFISSVVIVAWIAGRFTHEDLGSAT